MIPMYRSNAGNNVITPAVRRLLCRDDMWIGERTECHRRCVGLRFETDEVCEIHRHPLA